MYNPYYYNEKHGYPYGGYEALKVLLDFYKFKSVLDIGCGEGIHSDIFLENGKSVTALDYGESVYYKKNSMNKKIEFVKTDFNSWETDKKFDCIWCSHVLEHQWNVHVFLEKTNQLLKEGGVLAITVPPLKSEIVGGHVNLFTPGILLYNLIIARFDCHEAMVKTYDNDISVLVKKKSIDLPMLSYDLGDIRKLKKYFPDGIIYHKHKEEDTFNGNIEKLNWPV